jgi:tetratricopeptide (TPR) repeat protein
MRTPLLPRAAGLPGRSARPGGPFAVALLAAMLLATLAPVAHANGGGAMSMPSLPERPRELTPQQQAREAYNDGVHEVKKGDKASAAVASASDARKKDKAQADAQARYGAALSKFQQATQLDSSLHEAWNYLGYSSRKLGHYDDALAAYDKALSLKPGYPDALEYRAEAYLALNRISDAQQAYLDLYAGNRVLAGKLLEAMKGWVAAQRDGGAAAGANVDELDKWIQERAQIAHTTAALSRAGSAASWR